MALVEDFLLALGTGGRDNFASARKFLTPETEATWSPLEGATIYANSGVTMEPIDAANRIILHVPVEAYLDKYGRYTPAVPNTVEEVEFALVKNADDQWRIDSLPDRVYLDQYLFSNLYRQVHLYWVSADQSTLIPDARYFPVGTNQPAFVVTALLAGPSPWLVNVVHPPFPDPVSLAVNSVPYDDGVAKVDLTRTFLTAPEETQRVFFTQLKATLLPLANVSSVEITVEDGQVAVEELADLTVLTNSGPGPFVVKDGTVQWLNPDGQVPVTVEVTADVTAIAADLTAAHWVGRTDDGLVLLSDNNRDLIEERGLVDPAIDHYNWIWTGEATNDGYLLALPPAALNSDADVLPIEVPWLAGTKLIALEPSWDGTRLAVVYSDDIGTHVAVMGIIRVLGGDIAELTQPLSVGTGIDEARAITWSGITQLSVLGTRDEVPMVFRLEVGGPTTAIPGAEAVALAAGTAEPSLYVLDSHGMLFGRISGSWRPITSEVAMVGFAG